ncbi:MAG TPA: HIT family protein [Candidatus Paceibacterota bacterium]|nr:HIT family protein [Candidatus Paceibacterota bacterium]
MENCIFCKIVDGSVPAAVVYEDADTLAFLSIGPNTPGHTLVIPKAHMRNIFDMNEGSMTAVMRTVQKISRALQAALGAEGVNVIFNNEPAGNQVIFHAHAHVIPRKAGDGLHYESPEHEYAAGEADAVAGKMRDALS